MTDSDENIKVDSGAEEASVIDVEPMPDEDVIVDEPLSSDHPLSDIPPSTLVDTELEEQSKLIIPMMDEIYAILFDDREFIGSVTNVHELDKTVTLVSDGEEVVLLLNENGMVLITKTYRIVDIERVIKLDFAILDSLEDVEEDTISIDVEEVPKKEMIYTETETKESLLSDLIYCFRAYDNYELIGHISDSVDIFLGLLSQESEDYHLNLLKHKSLPKWLIPVIDNPIRMFHGADFGTNRDEGSVTLENLRDLISRGGVMEGLSKDHSYLHVIRTILQETRSLEPSVSETGVLLPNHSDHYYRDCLEGPTCLGINGNYSYDKRNNNNTLVIPTLDESTLVVHKNTTLKVVSLLYIPDDNLSQGLSIDHRNPTMTIAEKCILESVLDACSRDKRIKGLSIIHKSLDETTQATDISDLVLYNLTQNVSYDEFFELAKLCIPTTDKLLEDLDDSLRTKLMNYRDIRKLFIKYDMDPDKLTKDEKSTLNKVITDNVVSYVKDTANIPKTFIRVQGTKLSIEERIIVAKDLILRMINIPKKNNYLQRFMELFTRDAIDLEDTSWLYNSYNDEKILCKHYVFSSAYNKDPEAFNQLRNTYGTPPRDGNIYCRNCGEYLFDEEFSPFDGFSEEQPIVIREEMQDTTDILKDYNDDLVALTKEISLSIGVTLEDKDCKEVLMNYSNFDSDVLLNIRYKTMNILNSEEHPRITELSKKYKKEKNKKDLIKREKSRFTDFLKDTNKVIVITSLLMIVIQTSIPNYIFKSNVEFNLLEIEGGTYTIPEQIKLNMKLINYCHIKVKRLANKYKDDKFWNHYLEVSKEHTLYEVEDIKNQLINCIRYTLSPRCPSILKRISEYFTFLQGSSGTYTKDEWPIFKPLRGNHMITDIDTYMRDISNKDFRHFILNYNNYPVENIALLTGLSESKDTLIHELLKIPISDIMVNKAFITLFRLCVSHYGVAKHTIPIIDLHIERFLDTTNDPDEMRKIFDKHGWKSSKETGEVSYTILRTKVIPDIIGHYQGRVQAIEACYSDSEACNKFIHININNYDMSLINVSSKRIYSCKVPIVYPPEDFSELSDDIKKGLFATYCKDPNGAITKKQLNTYYLWKPLLNISGEVDPDIPDDIGIYEHNLASNEENFKEILVAIQSKYVPCDRYKKPISYTMDDYNISLIDVRTEETILSLFRDNHNLRLSSDNPVITTLQTYVEGVTNGTKMDIVSMKRTLAMAFSNLDSADLYDSIARFVSLSDPKHKKRFESIFINTTDSINISDDVREQLETKQFRYKNLREGDIGRILEVFTRDSNLSGIQVSNYIYQITSILSRLKNANTSMNRSSKIPKYWGIVESANTSLSEYMDKQEFMLHKDIFNKRTVYKGFYEHKSEHIYLYHCLYNHIRPYTSNLHHLVSNPASMISEDIIEMTYRYTILMIFNELIDVHTKIVEGDEEIVSELEQALRLYDMDTEIDSVIGSVCSNLIMDLVTNMLQCHYDSHWIVSNLDEGDLIKRLGKQKEREKQTLLHKLDSMSDDERLAATEQQKMGISNWFKASGEENQRYRESEVFEQDSDTERYERMNGIFKSENIQQTATDVFNGDLDETPINPVLDTVDEEVGYYDENDINEEGETGDEIYGFHEEVENPFNV